MATEEFDYKMVASNRKFSYCCRVPRPELIGFSDGGVGAYYY